MSTLLVSRFLVPPRNLKNRGGSSSGRAPRSQRGGRGFESLPLHHFEKLRVVELPPHFNPTPPFRSAMNSLPASCDYSCWCSANTPGIFSCLPERRCRAIYPQSAVAVRLCNSRLFFSEFNFTAFFAEVAKPKSRTFAFFPDETVEHAPIRARLRVSCVRKAVFERRVWRVGLDRASLFF